MSGNTRFSVRRVMPRTEDDEINEAMMDMIVLQAGGKLSDESMLRIRKYGNKARRRMRQRAWNERMLNFVWLAGGVIFICVIVAAYDYLFN